MLLRNPDLDGPDGWLFDPAWTPGSGQATKAVSATAAIFRQFISPVVGGVYEIVTTVTARSAGALTPQFFNGTVNPGVNILGVAPFTTTITARDGDKLFRMAGNSVCVASVGHISMKRIA